MSKREIDFFAFKGYRILAADLLMLTIHDANQDRNPRERDEAIRWLHVKDSTARAGGSAISFEGCMHILGWASRIEEMRKLCLDGDARLISQIKSMKAQLRDIRDDPLEDAVQRQAPVGGVLDLFTRGSMNMGRSRSTAEMADGLRGAM